MRYVKKNPIFKPIFCLAIVMLAAGLLLPAARGEAFAEESTQYVAPLKRVVTIERKRPDYIQAGVQRYEVLEATRVYDSPGMQNEIELGDMPFPCDAVIYYELPKGGGEPAALQIVVTKVHQWAGTRWSEPMPE